MSETLEALYSGAVASNDTSTDEKCDSKSARSEYLFETIRDSVQSTSSQGEPPNDLKRPLQPVAESLGLKEVSNEAKHHSREVAVPSTCQTSMITAVQTPSAGLAHTSYKPETSGANDLIPLDTLSICSVVRAGNMGRERISPATLSVTGRSPSRYPHFL